MLQDEVGSSASHHLRQLVVNNLHHQLTGLNGREHVLTHCLLFHLVGETFCHLVVDVGIQQGATNLFQGLGHINFGYFSFAFQGFERAF